MTKFNTNFFASFLAIFLLAMSSPGHAAEVRDKQVSRDGCRSWLRQSYPFEKLARRLDADLPLSADELWSCVEHDLQQMSDPLPLGWCDNVFKIHCAGLDVLTELGATQADGCEEIVRGQLQEPATPDHIRCLRDRTFERLVEDRQVIEGDDCLDVLKRECVLHDRGSQPSDRQDEASGDVQAHGRDRLARSWPKSGPDKLWQRPLGDGYSAILHDDGRLFTMSREGKREVVVALDAASGHTLWRTSYRHPEYRGQRGFGIGPRATPALAGGRLFTTGIAGTLVAFGVDDGHIQWRRELWDEELAGDRLRHGYSSSPLIWGDLVLVLVGGPNVGLVAFDQETGRQEWASPGLRNSYSSPILADLAGEEQVLCFMAEALVSVDPEDGSELWRFPHANSYGHNISVPRVTGDDRIFLSSPQAGARSLRVTRLEDGSFTVVEEWGNRRMQLYHVTSVFDGQWVYGSSGVATPAFLTAIDAATGEIGWKVRGFAKANVVPAGNRLIVLDEDGRLALAAPTADGLEIHADTQLFDSLAWTVPTLVGETLYVRNTEQILALHLGEQTLGSDDPGESHEAK